MQPDAQRSPDIEPRHAHIVEGILRSHVPDREVWLFGSRVRGAAKRYSDLDLAVIGDEPLSSSILSRLQDAFSESDLPYRVDVIDWASTSQEFQAIISSHSIIFRKPD